MRYCVNLGSVLSHYASQFQTVTESESEAEDKECLLSGFQVEIDADTSKQLELFAWLCQATIFSNYQSLIKVTQ